MQIMLIKYSLHRQVIGDVADAIAVLILRTNKTAC